MSSDSLGDRMKGYEQSARTVLPRRMPVIIRCDGKAFHTLTHDCVKPFDSRLTDCMTHASIRLCEQIQGAQLAYTQSDEISILVHGYKRFASETWFDNQVQKMVSVAASIAAAEFNAYSKGCFHKLAYFDARAFVLPEADVCNYFLWRQQDAVRNSIQMLARSLYSHKQCDHKNVNELQEMCFQKGQNWNDVQPRWKRGLCVKRRHDASLGSSWHVDLDIPTFGNDRDYVNGLLAVEEE